MNPAINNRRVYLDFMRIVAIFLVIFNHVPGYTLFMESEGVIKWVYLFFTMADRIAVPLFFMISGALLLGKDENFSIIFKKRILRFIYIICVFETGLYTLNWWNKSILKGEKLTFSLLELIHGIVSDTTVFSDSYWYMYAYMGMLLMLPFLRPVAKSLNKEGFCLLVAFHGMIYSFIPLVNLVLEGFGQQNFVLSISFQIPIFTISAITYPLMGYYLENVLDFSTVTTKKVRNIGVLALVGIVISSICTVAEANITGVITEHYVQMFDYLTTIFAFIFIKKCFMNAKKKADSYDDAFAGNRNDKGYRVIRSLGSLIFGVYLLDPYFKYVLYNRYEAISIKIMPMFFSSIGWCVISICLGAFCTWVLKKIPGLKKIL